MAEEEVRHGCTAPGDALDHPSTFFSNDNVYPKHWLGAYRSAPPPAAAPRTDRRGRMLLHAEGSLPGSHIAHSHTVHLPLGALLIWCAVCGTGSFMSYGLMGSSSGPEPARTEPARSRRGPRKDRFMGIDPLVAQVCDLYTCPCPSRPTPTTSSTTRLLHQSILHLPALAEGLPDQQARRRARRAPSHSQRRRAARGRPAPPPVCNGRARRGGRRGSGGGGGGARGGGG